MLSVLRRQWTERRTLPILSVVVKPRARRGVCSTRATPEKRSVCMERMTGAWYCYLALCVDKSLYCGVTVDIERRIQCHNKGQGAKYTRSRRPVELFCARLFPDKRSAMRAEARIKCAPARKKPQILHELALNAWKAHTSCSGV